MPTKPVTTFTFSTTALYTVGDRIGSPTKFAPIGTEGFIPGFEAAPEQANYCLNSTGEWITDWLSLGTFSPDLDAHIVETNASGQVSASGGVLGGTAAGHVALSVNENTGFASSTISTTNSSGGFALLALSNGASAGVRGSCSGTAPGVEGLATGGTGPGVRGTGNGNSSGVEGTGGATGHGGLFTSGGSISHGVLGQCVNDGNAGVQGQASSTGGHGGWGVRGFAGNNVNGGVMGSAIFVGADPVNTDHCGVYGSGVDASGVYGKSQNGYGVIAASEVAAPDRSALRIVPQDVAPNIANALAGDVYWDSGKDVLNVFEDSNWKNAHASLLGFAHGQSTLASATGFNQGTLTQVATASVNSPNAPKEVGEVNLEVSFNVRNGNDIVHSFIVEIRDLTDAVSIVQREFELVRTKTQLTTAPNTDAYEKSITVRVPYTLPLAGNRTFEVRLRNNPTGGAALDYADLMLTVDGVY